MAENEEKAPCSICGGVGTLRVEGDDLSSTQCVCYYARQLKVYWGPEIAAAKTLRGSFFFVPKGDDFTTRNLFIKAYWRELLPHVKWALGCKGTMFRYRVLTDEKLRTIYVGAESYTSRPRSKRDDMVTINTLADVVGPEIDLVIIRLGFLGYKNIAMPGILKEALMLREVACKPTWVVESPNAPLVPGHFAYSEDVFDYVAASFTSIKLSDFDEERDDGVAPQDYSSKKKASKPPVPVEDVDITAGDEKVEVRAEALGEPEPTRPRKYSVPPSAMRTDVEADTALEDMGIPSFSSKPSFKGKGRKF